jgi:hypothetical protein
MEEWLICTYVIAAETLVMPVRSARLQGKKCVLQSVPFFSGASDGNRTRAISLGS